MAKNAWFSCIRRKKFSINPKKNNEDFGTSKKVPALSFSVKKVHFQDMDRPPSSKRRKTEDGYHGETTTDEDWDDDDFDLQLTQADLERIDTISSQAITAPGVTGPTSSPGSTGQMGVATADPGPGTSVRTLGHQRSSNQGTFLKPRNTSLYSFSRNNSSSSSHGTSSSSRNTSISSSSITNGGGSDVSYPSCPATPCSSGSKSSTSLRSDSSLEMSTVGQVSRSTSAAGNSQRQDSSPAASGLYGDVERYKRESTDTKLQLTQVKNELSSKDGEIKILRDNLQRKEEEISRTKQEKMRVVEQQQREKSDREKHLRVSVDKLNTQLQFKDRELAELKERCHMLEIKQQTEGTTVASSPKKPTVPPHSPTPKRPVDRSPSGTSGFPTTQTFMADDRSPKAKSLLSVVQRRDTKDVGTCTVSDPLRPTTPASTGRRRRQFASAADFPGGHWTGAQLVSSLLDRVPSESGGQQSIVELLQAPTTGNLNLQDVHFDRDSSGLLSPIPNRARLSETRLNQISQCLSVGSSEHRDLAIQGLQCLLRDNSSDTAGLSINIGDLSGVSVPPVTRDSDVSGSSSSSAMTCIPQHQGGVLLLPLLSDYLGQYLDLLSCAVETQQSPPSSRGSSSLDSSIESLSSSLSLLLRDSAMHANNLEALALVALNILHRLVSHCAGVRDVLLDPQGSDAHTGIAATAQTEVCRTDSGGSNVISDWSAVSHWSCIRQQVVDMNIPRKIFRLANPGQGGYRYNVHVVDRALQILTVLSTHLLDSQVPLLLPVLHNSVLANSLECETDPAVVVRGLTLLTSLVKFNSFVTNLYVGPDGCLLCLLYLVFTGMLVQAPEEYRTQASNQLISCLYNIVSVHKGGMVLLLESDCRCSVQVIKTVILVLYRVLVLLEERQSSASDWKEATAHGGLEPTRGDSGEQTEGGDCRDWLCLLRIGVLLLHSFYQRDEHFLDHRYVVEHQYVRLVTGLTRLFRNLPGNFTQELNTLAELWDFDEEYNEFSQDSDEDTPPMDTS